MDQVQKTALKETAKIVLGLTAISVLVPTAILLVPATVLGIIVCLGLMGFVAKIIYDTELTKAKLRAELKNSVDQ